jgi:alpha-1,6-mannosyltransferase
MGGPPLTVKPGAAKEQAPNRARSIFGVNRSVLFLVAAGLLLLGVHLALTMISGDFAYGLPLLEKPVLLFVGLLLVGSFVFVGAVFSVRSAAESRGLLFWVIGIGLALRIVMLFSTPILEDDYFRYLLDGAMTANGYNPYRFAPEEIRHDSKDIPPKLASLASEGEAVITRVNHPNLRTIYPPVAQAVFALAHVLKPWSLASLRALFLMFDCATFLLLLAALRSLGLSPLWVLVYWWNPLIVKEFVNSAHMDVIILPLAVGSMMLAVRGRSFTAAALLAVATGAKLWPLVLLPVVIRSELRRPARVLLCLILFGFMCAALFLPVFIAGLDSDSGFVAYSRYWEMNDALYMLLLWTVEFLLSISHSALVSVHVATRALVLCILVTWTVRVLWVPASQPSRVWEQALAVVAALFLLSPTQFPWYYGWVIPFLVIAPRGSLILLSALLPLYYLRFYFDARDRVGIFDYGIVWLEYAPVWALLVQEWIRGRQAESDATGP